jgi:hexosaminidase
LPEKINMKYFVGSLSSFKLFMILSFMMFTLSCKPRLDYQQQTAVKSHAIIPLPSDLEFHTGYLTVDKNINFIRNESFRSAVRIIEESMSQSLTDGLTGSMDTSANPKIMFITDETLKRESYRILISNEGITISAGNAAGAFYASQSLRQMIWNATAGQKQISFKLSYLLINDSPRFPWRGFHIDVSRHFFTKEYIMKTIDWLALYKINKLQLHLTDDQGWRVEINQFPLLTETGAWRTFDHYDSICISRAKSDSKYELDPRFIKVINGENVYGGYYTKEDIREIISYAADNFIDVIPEIDMPGHMSAAISAYPFLSCTGSTGWGKEFSYPLCPCNSESMNFCYNVLDEITELFPDSLVHIGCDEVEKDSWSASANCQNFMNTNNLTDVNGIQNYFISHIQKYLEDKGKTVIAWDDVIDGQVDNKLVLMYWRDWISDSPVRAAKNGNRLILTPWTTFYLSSEHTDASLKNLYEFNPATVYSAEVLEKVIGVQGCVWSEEIPSEKMFEYLVYPRLQALSETAWSETKDWSSFKLRLKTHLQYMNAMHLGYREPNLEDSY